jgi:hypothetical protein
LVCAKALPATLLEALLYLPSFRILDAVEATDLLVCLVFAMNLIPLFVICDDYITFCGKIQHID